jgi:hypothetical protein
MKTSQRYVQDFSTIDWLEVYENREVDWQQFANHSGSRDSVDFIEFKKLYDNTYFSNGKNGLYHPTYVRLVATAVLMGL